MNQNLVVEKIKFFFLIFLFTFNFTFGEDFYKTYQSEISIAIKKYKKIETNFNSYVLSKNENPIICASIIFPELIRYSIIRDKMESMILMSFYQHFGKSQSNYSVGLFQMKPSFVERLEKELQKYVSLKEFSFIWQYPDNLNDKEIRRYRVERLMQNEWQVKYLVAFIKLIKQIHKEESYFLSLKTNSDKIAFFASSYNSGFWTDINKIIEYQNHKLYPYGYGKSGNRYSYSNISVYCYNAITFNRG